MKFEEVTVRSIMGFSTGVAIAFVLVSASYFSFDISSKIVGFIIFAMIIGTFISHSRRAQMVFAGAIFLSLLLALGVGGIWLELFMGVVGYAGIVGGILLNFTLHNFNISLIIWAFVGAMLSLSGGLSEKDVLGERQNSS